MAMFHWTKEVCLLRNLFSGSMILVAFYFSRHPFNSISADLMARFLMMVVWFVGEDSPMPDVTRKAAELAGMDAALGYTAPGHAGKRSRRDEKKGIASQSRGKQD